MESFVQRLFEGRNRHFTCDLALFDGPLMTTVEIKRVNDAYWADMFTSARHGEVDLNLVTRVQVTLGLNKNESEAIEEVKEIYSSHVGPLELRSVSAGGFSEPLNPPEADYRQAHAWFHLNMHAEAGNIPADGFPVAFRTALEYKLVKSFGFRAATPMIADFENVTSVAVDRRLFMAREANYISKASGAASKKGL